MTKKHFIALADRLREEKPKPNWDPNKMAQWEQDINAIVDFCKSQNPRFNEYRWREYLAGNCGPNGGKKK